MGGKKKTKWRKLPLGELTQGTARGSTVSGSLREQAQDGMHENWYDNRTGEHQWKETRQAGYYAQGPPHLYSSRTSPRRQDDVEQEEAAETDEKSDIFCNGFWIPDSDLDQFNTINNSSAFEPFFRQVPVFFCPPVMPYCSAPYPHFRTNCQSEGPLFANFCIPSDQHYYYYFTGPRTVSKEDEQPFEGEEETSNPPDRNNDVDEEHESIQQEPNGDEGETQQMPFLHEPTRETALPYPYPYTYGEPVYSVPVYPLLPPRQRTFPRIPWSATQTQRKRRRKRKEYNADYAIIPAPKSQGSTRSAAVKCDLDITGDETTCNNESRNQLKGNDTHSVSVTGSSPSTEETKQNDFVPNNQENDDAESAYLSQQDITTQDVRNAVDSTAHNKESPKKVRCKIIDNPASGFCSLPTYETEDAALIAEILTELIQKIVTEHSSDKRAASDFLSTQNETGNFKSSQDFAQSGANSQCDQVLESFGECNGNLVECENRLVKMENILRKNPDADFPEVHKNVQGIENANSYTSSKNNYSNEISEDSFIRNENQKNLSHGKPVKLSINEENRFFEIALVHEESDTVLDREEESPLQNEKDLQTSENNAIEQQESDITEHKSQKGASRTVEDLNSHSNITMENQSDCTTQSDSECRTDGSGTANREDGSVEEPSMDKNRDDSLDSTTSNESFRDRDKQLSGSHRSSPHSFLSYVSNSEALIRETELELSKIQHLTSRPPLQANQSIYKFAFDENLTDQSETEDAMTPIPSPLPELANGYRKDSADSEDAAISAEMRQDIRRSEIVVHEGDSGSEAGSEDVELLPHRYESQGGDKHLYMNKLSLAVELLRTHEKLPYDEEFKRVVDDEGENVLNGKEAIVTTKPQSNKVSNVPSGRVNPAFIGDMSPKIQIPVEISPQVNDRNVISVIGRNAAHLQEATQGQHRHSRISTADSGVQSEDSGDEMGEEAKETYGRLGFTESEEQELWNPAEGATVGYRRFGAQARQRFNIFAPRAGGLNPCFCCVIM